MTKLIVIALIAVAAVVAWVWFRRRLVLGKPLARDRRPNEQPSDKDAQASQRAEVGASLQRSAPAGEVSAVAAEPVEVFSIQVDLSCPPRNEATPHRQNETIRESEENHVKSATPPVASILKEEIVAHAKVPVSQPSVPGTTTFAPWADAACAHESVTQPDIADDEPAPLPTPQDIAATSLPATTPLSDRETEATTCESPEPPPAENEPLPKARSYSEPKPSSTTKTATNSKREPDPTPRMDANLPIRLQLVFGRGGSVKTLALIPHRREGMPSSLEVTTAGDRLLLSESSADSYESVPVSEVINTLSEGAVWQARGGAQRWRWELSRREIYVLAAGDAFGLSGFVTRRKDQRLWLNTRHVVLAKECLRAQIIGALAEAGCATPEVCDSTTPGVPSGWIVFRDVTPTSAVPMRDERDILNVLCPAHEIEPQFVGGVRLGRSDWLAGFPPRIRFAGELGKGFQVMIDSQPARLASDGAFESPGWDAEGEHRLWFCDRAETYALRTMKEDWDTWPAHDFGTGAAICGASTHRIDGARQRQICIRAENPLLVGARPGEIFRCRVPDDAHTEWILTLVPFTPVWALPINRLPNKNCSAAIVLVEFIEPLSTLERPLHKLNATSALRQWVFVIRNARRNRFVLAVQGEDAKALWRRYGDVANKLRRQLQ